MKNIKNYSLLLIGMLTLFFVSCKREEFNPDFDLPRQFKPGDINVTAGETQAKLQWNPSLFTAGKDVTYTVEVSTDQTFAGTPVHTAQVDTSVIIITDDVLEVGVDYYARVKANKLDNTNESGWVNSASFKITGEQIFTAIADADLKDKTVLLKWRPYAGLTKIILKPASGAQTEITLTAADVAANEKLITGLTPQTNYTAEIFKGTIKKGTVTFTTKEQSIYAVILNPGDDLIAAVNNAANGDIIGLNKGTYHTNLSGSYSNIIVTQKRITIQSVSNNPTDTKVNFKEINIKGTGAGITVKGIEWDGTAAGADYFINFTGLNSDAEAANFAPVIIDNSIVHNTNNALMRGNRGGNNAHKIDTIKVNNTIAYANGTGSYHYFMLDKMEFKVLEITNTTMYDIARALISWATNLTVPAAPVITIDQTTINNFGFGGRNNIILDANANNVKFTFKNSIIANTPKPGQSIGTSALRAGSASTIEFVNNNYFNLNGGDPLAPLTFPSYVQMANNLTIDLGWTATTTNFTIPSGSPLRTASTTGGPIGDPRWH